MLFRWIDVAQLLLIERGLQLLVEPFTCRFLLAVNHERAPELWVNRAVWRQSLSPPKRPKIKALRCARQILFKFRAFSATCVTNRASPSPCLPAISDTHGTKKP